MKKRGGKEGRKLGKKPSFRRERRRKPTKKRVFAGEMNSEGEKDTVFADLPLDTSVQGTIDKWIDMIPKIDTQIVTNLFTFSFNRPKDADVTVNSTDLQPRTEDCPVEQSRTEAPEAVKTGENTDTREGTEVASKGEVGERGTAIGDDSTKGGSIPGEGYTGKEDCGVDTTGGKLPEEHTTGEHQTAAQVEPTSVYPTHLAGLIAERSNQLAADVKKLVQSIPTISLFGTGRETKESTDRPAGDLPAASELQQSNTPVPSTVYSAFISQLSKPSFIQRIIEGSPNAVAARTVSNIAEKSKFRDSFRLETVTNFLQNDYVRWSYWTKTTKSAVNSSLSAAQSRLSSVNSTLFSVFTAAKQSASKKFKKAFTSRLFAYYRRKRLTFLTFFGAGLFIYGLGSAIPGALARYYFQRQQEQDWNRMKTLYVELVVCRLGVEGWKKRRVSHGEGAFLVRKDGFLREGKGGYQFVGEVTKER